MMEEIHCLSLRSSGKIVAIGITNVNELFLRLHHLVNVNVVPDYIILYFETNDESLSIENNSM